MILPRIFLLLACLTTALVSFAQPTRTVRSNTRSAPGVTLSETFKFGKRDIVPYNILPYKDNYFVTSFNIKGRMYSKSGLYEDLRSLKLHRYSSDLKHIGEVEIAWPDEQRHHSSIISLGEGLLWTFATESSTRGELELRAEILDDKGKVLAAHRLFQLEESEFGEVTDSEAWSTDRQYYTRVFAEESSQRLFSKKDEEKAGLTIAVFNNVGELITLKRTVLPVQRDQLEIHTVAVDNDGQAFILARVYGNSKRRETRGGSDSKVLLYTLAPGGEELEQIELKLAGQYIEGIAMVPGRDGDPAIVGLYSDKLRGRIMGYFSLIDPRAGEVLQPKEFSQQMLESLGRSVSFTKKGDQVIAKDFEFRDALRLSNGNLALLLELYREVTYTSNSGAGGFATMRTSYVYGAGVILTFDEKGVLAEALAVPKYQASAYLNGPFDRMNLVEYNGLPAVIYNDNPKNLVRSLDKRPKRLNMKKAVATMGFANRSGELQRDPLFARKNVGKLVLVPNSVISLNNDDVVFMALRFKAFGKNEVSFGRIRN